MKETKEHVTTHLKSLFQADKKRFMELIESIQYGLGYLVVGFFAGTLLDYSFPSFDESQSTELLFVEILVQSILLILLVFYVRKIVTIMPSLFNLQSSYKAYSASEYGGELMISLAVIGAQFHLIKKLDLLSQRIYKLIYNEERNLKKDLDFFK